MAQLNIGSIPDSMFLQQQIFTYQYPRSNPLRELSGKRSLKLLKAWDAVKDGSSTPLAYTVFDIVQPNERINQSECKNLPEYIKAHFENKVGLRQIRCLTYTRRKGSDINVFDDNNTLNADYGIPDCGPNYSDTKGKTPVIKSVGGDVMKLLFSLGNFMDTGPSSSNSINLKCNSQSYDIPQGTFETLGYNISNMNVNRDEFTILLNSVAIIKDQFKGIARGNADKKSKIDGDVRTNLDYKKQLLYFKSLGDTMIVYFWLWASRSLTTNSIALLTCDTVVALQADIFSQRVNNAYWVLNHNEKGDKHISRVYAKDAPPDYSRLFAAEKREILTHYQTEIGHFNRINETPDCEVNIGNRTLRPDIDTLLVTIHERLESIYTFVNSLTYNPGTDAGFTSYTDLKQYGLLPLIRSGDVRRGYTLIRTRFKFYVTDAVFLSTNRDKLNLEAIINSYMTGVRGGRNSFYINDDPANHDSIFLKDGYTTKKSDTLAIKNLKYKITKIFSSLIKKLKSDVKTIIDRQFIKLLNSDDYGSVYDMLTYEFYVHPLYSSERIEDLCEDILESIIESIKVDSYREIDVDISSASRIPISSASRIVIPQDIFRRGGLKNKARRSNKSSEKQKTSSRRTRKRHHIIK
jgi:hypothetical protein